MTEVDTHETEFQFEDVADSLHLVTKKFAFQALLDKAAAVVPTRDIQPVLRNFLVEAESGKIRVSATDNELSIIAVGQLVVVQKPGSCVLPAAKMLNIVKEANGDDLEIEVTEGKAYITVGATKWTLRVADSNEYPPLPEEGELEFTEIDRAQFVSALGVVRYAACKDTLKPQYMMVDVRDGQMRAADGVRFQQVPAPGVPDMQLPVGAVEDLVKTLRGTEVPKIGFGQDEHQLVFRIGLDTFVASKLTAQFPAVDEVLLKPAQMNDQELKCDRNELIGAIRRVRITADEETSAVVMDLGEALQVNCKDKYGSWSTETINATWQHSKRTAAFNWAYLLEMLLQVEDKTVLIRFGKDEPGRPSTALIEDAASGGQGVLHQLHVS